MCIGKSKERMESYFDCYRRLLLPTMKSKVDSDDFLLTSMEAWDNEIANNAEEALKRKGMTADVGINDCVVGKKKNKRQLEFSQSDQEFMTLEFGLNMTDVDQMEVV